MTDVVVRMDGPFAPESDTPSTSRSPPAARPRTKRSGWPAMAPMCTWSESSATTNWAAPLSRALRDEGVVVQVTELSGATQRDRRRRRRDRRPPLDAHRPRRQPVTRQGHRPTRSFRPRAICISGYELLDEETRGPALSIAALAKDEITRSIDPCSAGPLAAVGADAFLSWTEGFDLCCSNLDEGRVLTGLDDPLEVLAIALATPYPTVCRHPGREGRDRHRRRRRADRGPGGPTGQPSSTRLVLATPSPGRSSPPG